ncbi:MAG: diguanylate cyclase [Proteobacteria bacterium]|nr:diguanylate cyclase [Pseudomonadota bacterium]
MTEASALDAPHLPAAADEPIRVLLVEDEAIVAQDLEETIARLGYTVLGVASEGVQAVCMAAELHPQLIVMDVGLQGDIDGIQAAQMIRERAPVPVIFLTGHRDVQTLRRAVSTGPLGYLVKPFQEIELRCAMEVAIHKHRAEVANREREAALRRNVELLASLSLVDELTQLHNRRGFFELAQQALKVARREQHTLGIFFMDLNGLKQINDQFGHSAGDQALRDAAEVLRRTFRESDIVARLGGDEFVALARVNRDTSALNKRLREQVALMNTDEQRHHPLQMSIGTALFNVTSEDDVESLIARADAAMYEEKRSSNRRSGS